MKPLNEHTNLIFAHVPKCAGTSIVATLRDCRNAAYPIRYGQIDQTWKRFMSSGLTGQFVYGHLRYRHLEELEASDMDYRLITFLRHPVERLISVYRYNASPASPGYNDFVKRWPKFEPWVRWYSETFPNDIASFTVGDVRSVEEYAEKMLSRFHFIGFQETYKADVTRLIEKLKIAPDGRERRENQTQNTPHNKISMTDDLWDEVERLNWLDMGAHFELKNRKQ